MARDFFTLLRRLPDPGAERELDRIADAGVGRNVVQAHAVHAGKSYHYSEQGLEHYAVGSQERAIVVCKLMQGVPLGAFCGADGWIATAHAWLAGRNPQQEQQALDAQTSAYLRAYSAKEQADRIAREAARKEKDELDRREKAIAQAAADQARSVKTPEQFRREHAEWASQ
ncbi:MAG TPA: hypothetical protein VGI10_12530 [Polyangiaceae bacterium]|jgi:hypothetical protein